MRPVRLAHSFHEKIWGTTELEPWFPRAQSKVGEVWFTHEPELPLLVKFLFTSARLSVQVHPADADGERGKSEMWHILRAAPDAAIALGFREPISRERLREAARSGEIEYLLDWKPVRAGETYYVPAHTVHAIGAGLALCEIQQQSDITYRLYDYGRPRELHLEKAVGYADLGRHPGAAAAVVESEHFRTEPLEVTGDLEYRPDARKFHLLVCIAGSGTLAGEPFRLGEVWLAPAGAAPFEIHAGEPARFLRTHP